MALLPLIGLNKVCKLKTPNRPSAISCLPLKPMNEVLSILAPAPKYEPLPFFEELKASWSKSETLPDPAKLWDEVRASKVAKEEVTSNIGDAEAGLGQDGAKVLKATYDFAINNRCPRQSPHRTCPIRCMKA